MLYRYFSILLACVLMLAGLQVPSFVDQYEKRVDAHLTEVTENLRGFQEIADQLYGGSLDTLIEKHRVSDDLTFQLESEPIKRIYQRFLGFRAEKQQLASNPFNRVSHIALNGDKALLQETINQYSYTITLNEESLISALVALVFGLLTSDLITSSLGWMVRRRSARGRAADPR